MYNARKTMGRESKPHTPQLDDFKTERLSDFRGARIIVGTVEGPHFIPGEITNPAALEDEADRLLSLSKSLTVNLRPLGHLTLAEYSDRLPQN